MLNLSRDCLELLLKAGVSANIACGNSSALMECCGMTGRASCMRSLISYGADINFQEHSHQVSCVQRCCTSGNTEGLDILLRAGACTEVKDLDGDGPIQQAVFSQRIDCVKLLIAHGANLYERNYEGMRAIDFADDKPEIKAILQSAMGEAYAYSTIYGVQVTMSCCFVSQSNDVEATVPFVHEKPTGSKKARDYCRPPYS